MKRILLALCLSIPVVANAESVQDMYPGPWQYEFNTEITTALVVSKVKGCGQYRYRVSTRSTSEFLVYCSRDGEKWLAYMVWPKLEKALGPYQPDPALP